MIIGFSFSVSGVRKGSQGMQTIQQLAQRGHQILRETVTAVALKKKH
nr:hypothetical protein [Pantoea sp. 201603H]